MSTDSSRRLVERMAVAGPRDEGVGADQIMLARSVGALLSLPRFDSPIHLARVVHGAALALAMFSDALSMGDGIRLRDLRSKSLEIACRWSHPDAEREWLIALMGHVLGKAGEVAPAENQLH